MRPDTSNGIFHNQNMWDPSLSAIATAQVTNSVGRVAFSRGVGADGTPKSALVANAVKHFAHTAKLAVQEWFWTSGSAHATTTPSCGSSWTRFGSRNLS